MRSFCTKNASFFKNLFFSEFRSIKSVFRSIEIVSKIQKRFCVFRSVLDWFWINRRIFDRSNLIFDRSKILLDVFKKGVFHVKFFTFSKTFQTFCLLTNRSSYFWVDLSFSSKLFAQSLSPKAGKTSLPHLLLLFSYFMH